MMEVVKVIDVLLVVLPGFVFGNSIKDDGHIGLVSGK